jgi:hypothetical protein
MLHAAKHPWILRANYSFCYPPAQHTIATMLPHPNSVAMYMHAAILDPNAEEPPNDTNYDIFHVDTDISDILAFDYLLVQQCSKGWKH